MERVGFSSVVADCGHLDSPHLTLLYGGHKKKEFKQQTLLALLV